jgi:hypothetical protein
VQETLSYERFEVLAAELMKITSSEVQGTFRFINIYRQCGEYCHLLLQAQNSPREVGYLYPEDEGTKLHRNVGSNLPVNTVSYPEGNPQP